MDASFIQEFGERPAGSALGLNTTQPARLLVVDDEESVALTVGEVLRQEGYEVETASSGNEAVGFLNNAEFDLVLTDLHMEGGDGLSVLTEVRRRAPFTIAIVLTGFASVESAIAALRHGAYDYLIKPCIIDDLKMTVRRGVDHRRLILAEQRARAHLEELNRELEQRVEERTSELTRVNEELAAANQSKDIFLATLSHELRTPLTPILGWINLLRTGQLGEGGLAQALDVIERNARLQSRLIDDLLDISRIATGKLRFEPKPVDLNKAAEAALETVRASAEQQQIELVVTFTAEPLVVSGEPIRLQQIIWNLLSNAVKFTEPGGRVHLRTEAQGPEARVVVEDSGVGIALDFLPHVFDRFRQADGTRSRRYSGLGLGLAIVDALTTLHNGRVVAESAGPGHGARFTLTLPRLAHAEQVASPQAAAAPQSVCQRVLVIDDSPDTLELLHMLFEQKGSKVCSAGTAAEALKLAAAEPPNIIISDLGMPGMDGYELLAALRRLPGLARVPAIAISGYAMDEDRARSLRAGFAAHLAKPLDIERLFALIQQLVARNS
ncbi:MAG TPA: response regulator [Pyrinomonadaceae bacterium]|jgi:signal transduction histidine kinase